MQICLRWLWLGILLSSCRNYYTVQFFAINDTYEIAPLSGGAVGGMARVATVYKREKAKQPNTFFVHAGDFLSPSVLSTLRFEGKRIAGRHMVEAMNTMGVQYATFGNHEFDLEEHDLIDRIQESNFQWITTNILHRKDSALQPFFQRGTPLPTSVILQIDKLRIGILAVSIPVKKPFITFKDIYQSAQAEYAQLASQCDAVIALTHLELQQDKELARRLPGLALIIGGHEHHHIYHRVGKTIIAKADANAKTAYIHRLKVSPKNKKCKVVSRLIAIRSSIEEDSATAAVVNRWQSIARANLQQLGFQPDEMVAFASTPWNGMEKYVRNQPTNLSQLIAKALWYAVPDADAAIINAGAIRIDDYLEGNITQYDIMRILPFGGKLVSLHVKGGLLKEVLQTGRNNKGTGGYLVSEGIQQQASGKWFIGGKPLQEEAIYHIVTTDFLASGKEFNLEFFNPRNDQISNLHIFDDPSDVRSDIRHTLIAYLKLMATKNSTQH